ncbi:MAG: hypothetical protein Q9M18_06560 [Mariprofundaceae bacterium]|nr:hypothetical protein [Mariprofundaceae bacterium]
MNIHEYQAKEILKSFAVSVPHGSLALSSDEAVQSAKALGGSLWVVKAQIHAGGRGKAGGVRVCPSLADVKSAADALLGSVLVSKQTGLAGKKVHKIYIEEGLDIAQEFYLALLVDRELECISFMASPSGGMDIEEVAAHQAEKIATFPIRDIQTANFADMAAFLGLQDELVGKFETLTKRLYQMFVAQDAAMLEINPLVLTRSGD